MSDPSGGGDLELDFEHTVQQGDGVESIAFDNGFFPETIWNWSENSDLKSLRGDMNILAAGDVVRVPKLRTKDEDVATEQKHTYRRKGVPEILSVILLDHEGEPFANKPYRINIDGSFRDGQTDADGQVKEWIPPGATTATIIVDQLNRTYEFSLGAIDPINTARGVAHRLHALGYALSETESDLTTDDAIAAITRFQEDETLEATGEMNDETRSALKERFGS